MGITPPARIYEEYISLDIGIDEPLSTGRSRMTPSRMAVVG
jgi:hypothetical protein